VEGVGDVEEDMGIRPAEEDVMSLDPIGRNVDIAAVVALYCDNIAALRDVWRNVEIKRVVAADSVVSGLFTVDPDFGYLHCTLELKEELLALPFDGHSEFAAVPA